MLLYVYMCVYIYIYIYTHRNVVTKRRLKWQNISREAPPCYD